MDLKLTHCFITVDDQDAALAFYRDVLGLDVKTDLEMGGGRWLTVVPPAQPDVEIVLETPDGRPGGPDAVTELMHRGGLVGVILATDDCDATFATLVDAGAPVVQEPADQPYGVRDCAVRDPAGNLVRFTEALGGR